MKQLFTAVCLVTLIAALPLAAQAPAAAEEQQLAALVKEVQGQQAQILSNQGQVQSKLTEIAEIIRAARLFSGRSK